MDDPKFVETELKVTASEDLEKQVQEELEEETPEIAISSVLSNKRVVRQIVVAMKIKIIYTGTLN